MNFKTCLVATVGILAFVLFTLGNGNAAVLAKGTPVRIMCVGDSITMGAFVTGGYRKPLREMLTAGGYSITYVGKEDDGEPANKTGFSDGMENPNHEGYGNFTVEEILTGGTEQGHTAPPIAKTLATYQPDVILMMLGTNDVLQHHQLDATLDSLRKLIETVFNADDHATLVLAQNTPLAGEGDAIIVTYNAQVARLVTDEQTQGRKIVLVNMHPVIDVANDLHDGIHPTQKGYNKVAAAWYEALTGEKSAAAGNLDSAPASAATSAPAPIVTSNATVSDGNAAVLSKKYPIRVMCVGDSITEGKFIVTGGYRKPLRDLLTTGGYSIIYVGKEDDGELANKTGFAEGMVNSNHEGYGSFRIDQILDGGSAEGRNAPSLAESIRTYHPDVILMMLGTNDILQHYEMETIGDRIHKLADAVFAADDRVLLALAQITPLSGNGDATVVAYNAQIAQLVSDEKAQGRNIILADIHSALDPAHDLSDGIHPTQQGYDKMAGAWYEALTGEKTSSAGNAGATPAPVVNAPATPVVTAPIATGADVFTFTAAQPEQNNNNYVLGYQFTTGDKAIAVAALGYLNDGEIGAKATHAVVIYEVSSKQMVTPVVTVTTSGGSLSGENATFTYVKLDKPVQLAAHTAYAIAAVENGLWLS